MLKVWSPTVLAAVAVLSGSVAVALPQDEPDKPLSPTQPVRRPPSFPDGMPSSEPLTIADRIAKAHNAPAWRAHDAFSCNITVEFGGQTMLEGSMLVDTKKDRVRFDLTNGTKLIWDGEHAWVSPAAAMIESPRYHLRTWPFFLKAPFELQRPGTKIEDMPATTIDHRVLNAFKLTFNEKSGRDTPNDWFIVYSDVVTHTLAGMAYISTWGGKTVQEAEREPHIMFFGDPAILNTIVIARTWAFYHWSESQGKFGEIVGKVTLRDVGFTQLRDDTFKKPEDAREVEMPGAADGNDDDDGEQPEEPMEGSGASER
jgi:hypothetical protein